MAFSCAIASGTGTNAIGNQGDTGDSAMTNTASSLRSVGSCANRSRKLLILVGLAGAAPYSAMTDIPVTTAKAPPFVSADASAHTRAITVPFSTFASDAAKAAYAQLFATDHQVPAADADIAVRRAYYDRFNSALAKRAADIYPVHIEHKAFGSVKVEVITPKEGVAAKERDRVLINLHGGAFLWGEGSGGEIESIPIASVGRITVITVAYRQGPEYKFPAASEDVATVYRALLKDHAPGKIGIYGCSAGGILTAEALAWLQKEHLPMPGAVGIFCASAGKFGGDSVLLAPELAGQAPLPGSTQGKLSFTPYFSDVLLTDPLVLPMNSKQLLAHFPPTLLLAGSRDFAVSSVCQTDIELTKAGVKTELHVWDGLWHSFFNNPDLPESREMYSIVVNFFDSNLR
jgi:monoterpene epsilon-lactone hydrolase